jgi:chitinase
LHGSWEKFTGHHSALYSRSDETDPIQTTLNVDFAVRYWIEKGFPKEKIVLGLPTYGRSFELSNSNEHELGSPAIGPGPAGTV